MRERKTRKPRGEEHKNQEIHIRMTRSQLDLLELLCYEDEKTKTDMIVKALTYYSNLKNGRFNDPLI